MTLGGLWNYYRDEMNDANENDDANNKINNNKTTTTKHFEYKTKSIGSTPNNNCRSKAEFIVPLEYLSYFLNFSFINCETEPDLTRWKFCLISEISTKTEVGGENPMDATLTAGATFQINKTKFYDPLVTLLINDRIKICRKYKARI